MEEEKVFTRSKGVVTKFNDQKGYGFIQPDEGDEDLFVHQTAVKSDGFRTLREGQIVEFTIILEGDKTKAVDVTAPGGGPVRRGSNRNNRGGAGGGYGFSDRRNGGGGGGECYNCGDFGHMARDCIGRIGGGNDSSCYNCGGYGHLMRECPSASRRGGGNSGACFACGEPGHMARDCMGGGSNRGGGGGFGRFGGRGSGVSGGKCFNCGESGHFARECRNRLADDLLVYFVSTSIEVFVDCFTRFSVLFTAKISVKKKMVAYTAYFIILGITARNW